MQEQEFKSTQRGTKASLGDRKRRNNQPENADGIRQEAESTVRAEHHAIQKGDHSHHHGNELEKNAAPVFEPSAVQSGGNRGEITHSSQHRGTKHVVDVEGFHPIVELSPKKERKDGLRGYT